jgi:HSP20 family protein
MERPTSARTLSAREHSATTGSARRSSASSEARTRLARATPPRDHEFQRSVGGTLSIVPRREDVDRLQGEIAELFDDLWRVPSFTGLRHGYRPQVDCYRTESPPELTVVVELPGVAPDDLEIAILGQDLLLAGLRRRPSPDGRTYSRVEIEHGAFERRIPLGEDVDTSAARTTFESGILTIVLPIAEPQAPSEVRVRIEVWRPA